MRFGSSVGLALACPRHRTNRSNLNLICQQFGQCQVETWRRLVRCCYRCTQISHKCRYPPSFLAVVLITSPTRVYLCADHNSHT